jgi:hypothetical protein
MPPKSNKSSSHQNQQESRAHRAYEAMLDVRGVLYKRLVDYVLANEGRIRDEVNGEDSYSFTLQQLDEQFLNKMNVVERAVSELSRNEHHDGQIVTTTYEALTVVAKRDELPQKIAETMAEHSDSDFLDMCVVRADDLQAEVLIVMAREDTGLFPPLGHKECQGQGETGEQSDDSQNENF